MLFHSPEFLGFFILFLIGLPFAKNGIRTHYCLIASLIFYAWWHPPYLLVLLGLTILTHYGTLMVVQRASLLWPVIIILFIPLAIFKYTGFVNDNINLITGTNLPVPDWALPLGISFITFTAVAYVVDAHRRAIQPESSLAKTALFISFFPQLIAGPILRARELLPQLTHITFVKSMLPYAALLFAIGALKKVLFADTLAPFIDRIYTSEDAITLGQSLLAFYGFTVQIYCDFSGYTDMALALAALLGVRLPRNFAQPYLATSIRQFWRRWHMTLSRWLRDYLYIGLGGNRKGLPMTIAAVMITMLLGGLWHGAAWTFVIWGGLHGLYIIFETIFASPLSRLGNGIIVKTIRRLVVLHLVAIAWVFFRAQNMDQAMNIFNGFLNGEDWSAFLTVSGLPLVIISLFGLSHFFDNVTRVRWAAGRFPKAIILPLAIMILSICAALSVDNPNSFIYFDF